MTLLISIFLKKGFSVEFQAVYRVNSGVCHTPSFTIIVIKVIIPIKKPLFSVVEKNGKCLNNVLLSRVYNVPVGVLAKAATRP